MADEKNPGIIFSLFRYQWSGHRLPQPDPGILSQIVFELPVDRQESCKPLRQNAKGQDILHVLLLQSRWHSQG
jgi:hypothetical protein